MNIRSCDQHSKTLAQGSPEEYTAVNTSRSECSESELGAEQHDEVSSPAAGDKRQGNHQEEQSQSAAAEVGICSLFVMLSQPPSGCTTSRIMQMGSHCSY